MCCRRGAWQRAAWLDDIPAASQFTYRKTCYAKLGICETHDARLRTRLLHIGQTMRTNSSAAAWYVSWGSHVNEKVDILFAYCAMVRSRNPALFVYALAELIEVNEDERHLVLIDRGYGKFGFATQGHVANILLHLPRDGARGTVIQCIWMQRQRTVTLTHTLHRVELLGDCEGDPVQLF